MNYRSWLMSRVIQMTMSRDYQGDLNPYWQISETVLLENSSNRQFENSGASHRPFHWKTRPKECI